MKYLKSFYSMNEDLDLCYDFSVVDEKDTNVKYQFLDDFGNKFLVVFKNDTIGPEFSKRVGDSWEVIYLVEVDSNDKVKKTEWPNKSGRFWSIEKIVPTNIYKVVATVLGDITTNFLSNRPETRMLRLEGLSKDGESGLTKRTKLYKRFLDRNPIDGYSVEDKGNRIFIVKKR
jgi:hypothetical protein